MSAAVPNFADKTIWTGDNLDILRGMNAECVDLIYLDPPFNSNRDYEAPIGSKAAGASFKDTWTLSDLDVAWMGLIADEQPAVANLLHTSSLTHGKGMQSYLTMMAVRLMEMRRVLKPTGSIYLHCDPAASHYLKLLMDATFGQVNFRNEVIWHYQTGGASRSRYSRKHDVLLFYSVGNTWTFNSHAVKVPRTEKAMRRAQNPRGARIAVDNTHKNPVDVFIMQQMNPMATERVGYPTQKPLALLERIIKASSNEGDVVLDPFCGCATACVAADQLGRRWVGIDISPKAVELVNMRLRQAMGSLFHHGYVTARTDIPRRTDIDAPIHYRKNKHVLFGQQEGLCNGCKGGFPFKLYEVDHMVPQSKGGTGHLDNLQLLCGSCNKIKGNRPQEYLIAQLKELAYA